MMSSTCKDWTQDLPYFWKRHCFHFELSLSMITFIILMVFTLFKKCKTKM